MYFTISFLSRDAICISAVCARAWVCLYVRHVRIFYRKSKDPQTFRERYEVYVFN